MDDSKKNTVGIVLALIGGSMPFLMRQSQDCYPTQSDCQIDWGTGDCTSNAEPHANQCHYLGRSHYSFFRYGAMSSRSVGTISRGGFGSIGHGFSSGS